MSDRVHVELRCESHELLPWDQTFRSYIWEKVKQSLRSVCQVSGSWMSRILYTVGENKWTSCSLWPQYPTLTTIGAWQRCTTNQKHETSQQREYSWLYSCCTWCGSLNSTIWSRLHGKHRSSGMMRSHWRPLAMQLAALLLLFFCPGSNKQGPQWNY